MLNDNEKILEFKWIRTPDKKGEHLFTFDGKKVYNLFRDYPHALSEEEKALFDSINPFWANFFRNRK